MQWRIAVEFSTLYEHAHCDQLRAHDPGWLKVDGGRLSSKEPCDSQLTAPERLTRLRTELGEGTFGLIVAVAVEEHSFIGIPCPALRWRAPDDGQGPDNPGAGGAGKLWVI